MPLKQCTNKKGQKGWSWGNGGCIVGPGAKKRAIKVGIKVEGPEKFKKIMEREHSKGELEEEDLLSIFYDKNSSPEEVSSAGLSLGFEQKYIDKINKVHKLDRYIYEQAKKMTRKSINDLPDSDFAYIENGGKKDDGGKTVPRSLRHFPIHDAAHVRNALARLPQSKLSSSQKATALRKIRSAAKKFGIKTSDKSKNTTKD